MKYFKNTHNEIKILELIDMFPRANNDDRHTITKCGIHTVYLKTPDRLSVEKVFESIT